MFDKEEFNENAHAFVDWITEYMSDVEKYPVCPEIVPGEIYNCLPKTPPLKQEGIPSIMKDFKEVILPGITHWQSPSFHAYFPANNSTPSILAEFLTAAMGIQGMKWITSPAATELEELMMKWLREMLGLPKECAGVIHDTASVATLCAVLVARERSIQSCNKRGLQQKTLRVYCSSEAHSSIEKAVRIAGIGSENLVKVPVNENMQMSSELLDKAIVKDLKKGYIPSCIIAAFGTTGTCAIDPIGEISKLAEKHSIWMHVDAAFAGTALLLPEFRNQIAGLDALDSFVFNPHKWMFTNFDCSVFFVRNQELLKETFRLVPNYLITSKDDEVNDFSNFGIQLGRRFRALKLWFVIRYYGLEGLQEKIREHIELARWFEDQIRKQDEFEMVVSRNLVVNCFRFAPAKHLGKENLNQLNKKLLDRINKSGKVFLSHTIVDGKFTLRMVSAQTHVELKHMKKALNVIIETAEQLK